MNLTFTLPGDKTPIEVTGEIVSAAAPEDLRMGVKFTNLSAEAQGKIDAFLAPAPAGRLAQVARTKPHPRRPIYEAAALGLS